jgi:hypothetical protein
MSRLLKSVLLVLCAGNVCLAAQGPKTALRPKLTPAQRLERLTTTGRHDNPVLTAMIDAFERSLQGMPESAATDRVVRRALQRHPKLDKQMLQTAVENWKSIPIETRRRLATPRGMVARSTLPHITAVYGVSPAKSDPAEPVRIIPGKGMMIDSRNVPADPAKVKVLFLEVEQEKTQIVATAIPSKAVLSATGVTTLLVTVPANLTYGDYLVQLEVTSIGKSNEMWVSYPRPELKFTPKITSVNPTSRYPFTKAAFQNSAAWPTITGTLFTKAMKAVIFEPVAAEDLGSYRQYGAVDFISMTQLKFEVPPTILPGKYRIALASQNKPISNWVNFTVRAPLYRVKFTMITCADESDPETGSDSIRTIWAIGADPGALWVKMAAGYNDFGDHVSKYYKPEHQWVYQPDGQKREVRRYLYVVTSLWEWDSGEDWDERINATLGVAADVAMEIDGGQVSYGALAHYVVEALEELVILFNGEPNFIGGKGDDVPELAFTADILQKLTSSVPSYEGTLPFTGNDDTGSYQLTYKIFRDEP